MTMNITATKRTIPNRGQNRSADARDWQDEVIADLINLNTELTTLRSSQASLINVLHRDIAALKSDLARRDEEDLYFRPLNAINQTLTYVNGFSSMEDIIYNANTPVERRCLVEREFGEIVPPRNRAYNMFLAASLDSQGTIYPRNLSYTLTTDEPSTATVDVGDVRNAFNGNNTSYWIRKASLPAHDDTDSVSMTLTVTVPSGQVFQPNEMYVVPFPYKGVEVTNVEYSTDLTDNFKSIASLDPRYGRSAADGSVEFIPRRDASPFLIHFPPTSISQLRITITQPNWVEENAQKVFYYGAQEIGLRFVDYDKTADPDYFSHTKNNNGIVRIPAPTNYVFNTISYFMSEPWDPSTKHLRFQIATDEDFINVVWDTDQPLPQATGASEVSISVASSWLYVKVLPLFVGTESGSPLAGSPFFMNSPAFVDALALQYTVRTA